MIPHPVDIHVGKRLRSRRTILGMSQEDIGSAVGITFQQVQKYERGLNRMGSSRLYEFATLLSVSISYFFEDFAEGIKHNANILDDGQFTFEHETLSNKEVMTLVRSYHAITDQKIRKKILSLVRAIATSEADLKKVYSPESKLKEQTYMVKA
jgi:transcriptional regulator with XRE-family HTH domain